MNAYVSQRGHDIGFFNFGIIRDITMVGGGGRSKGSKGFSQLMLCWRPTGKKALRVQAVVSKTIHP